MVMVLEHWLSKNCVRSLVEGFSGFSIVFQLQSLFFTFDRHSDFGVKQSSCLMMEGKDYPGRRGWFPLIMLVHSFRTKMPVPDKHREGLFLLIRH